MRSLPAVSVIVPVYNGERTLPDCLESLLALDYPSNQLEIIVVDNASTDGTSTLLEAFAARVVQGSSDLPRALVLRERTRGPGAARNRGLQEANGEVVAFTDSDCVVEPDWLRHLVLPLADPEVGVSAGRILAKRPCTEVQRFSEMMDDHALYVSRNPPSAITMNWASPLALLRELGGFDERFKAGEDSDLAYRIFLEGRTFVYAEHAVVHHENPDSLLRLMREGIRDGISSVRLGRKHAVTRKAHGVRRVYLSTYRQLATDLVDVVGGANRTWAACSLFFGVGKKVGRLTGSIRFGYLAL